MDRQSPHGSQNAADSLRALAEQAMHGDHDAFEGLYRRLRGGVFRQLMKHCGGQAELAEELCQKTWVEVWRALHSRRYDPSRSAVSTFVYAVGYKIWLQHRRRVATRPRPADLVEIGLAAAGGDEAQSDAIELAELIEAMRQCLHATGTPFALTEQERLVVLGHAQGESERGMADKLGVAASTVNVRKAAAYAKLRQCLAAKGFGP